MQNSGIEWCVRVADPESGNQAEVDVRWRAIDSASGSFPPVAPARGDLIEPKVKGAKGAGSQSSSPSRSQSRLRRPDHSGRLTALRSPLGSAGPVDPPALTVEIPDSPGEAAGIPWAAIVPSVLTGAVAAFVFSPLFALLAAASAAALLGRWFAGRLSNRKAKRRRETALEASGAEYDLVVPAWLNAEADRRRTANRNEAQLLGLREDGSTPWQERHLPGEPLTVSVGDGDVVTPIPGLVDPESIDRSPGGLLRSVPIRVEIQPGRGLGVVGDRGPSLAAVRWLVTDMATRFGPADLDLVLITTPDRLTEWDWLKWLPSLGMVAVTEEQIDQALAGLTRKKSLDPNEAPQRAALVVVDGPEPKGPGGLAKLFAGRLEVAHIVWLGADNEVPAACSQRLAVSPDEVFHLVDLTNPSLGSPEFGGQGIVRQLTETEATVVARWLAPFDDPEREEPSARLPHAIGLASAAGLEADIEQSVRRSWDRANRQCLLAPIGFDESGPVQLDLVADGPHALVAGTTGSGKSEALRTLVAAAAANQPPDLVSFVLIDFKGGGAFDVVAGLPHVAALVTDLDAHEAARALRSLRAEMLDREQLLRDIGVNDIGDIPLDHPLGFPRLVVVVDEFAALADELPDFLDGLVDVARRGRSLGVHLVLATQRPAGVVTGQIRANTNLRLCLRVQDRGDSIDVIDGPEAANLPEIPGRAVLRQGSGPPKVIQVARLAAEARGGDVEPFVLHPSLLESRFGGADRLRLVALAGEALRGGVGQSQPEPLDPTTEIPAVTTRLAEELQLRLPAPPWLAPLTAVTEALLSTTRNAPSGDQSGANTSSQGGSVPLGLLDDPDQRRRVVLSWDSEETGVLILGSNAAEVEHSVCSAVISAVRTQLEQGLPVPSVYVLDGASGGLAALAALPCVGDVVPAREPARMLKAVEMVGAASQSSDPTILVVNSWAAVAEALEDEAGLDAVGALTRLVRRAGNRHLSVIVSGSSDRDVPSRVTSHLGLRILHNLSDPAGFLTFGLRSKDVPELADSRCVDPTSGLSGAVVRLDEAAIPQLVDLLNAAAGTTAWPEPVRILGNRVARSQLPSAEVDGDQLVVPIGLDLDLQARPVRLGPRSTVLVLGQPGSGRSTTLATIRAAMGAEAEVIEIDDAEAKTEEAVQPLLDRAASENLGLVVGCTPAAARGFGGWVTGLLPTAQVVLLNPSRADGELCRVLVPDLSNAPVGRAALVDRGRVTVLQIAA